MVVSLIGLAAIAACTRGRSSDDAEVTALKQRVAPFRRNVWKPVLGPDDERLDGSRYGGRPWLAPDEPWPPCPRCGAPLYLAVQVNLAEVPERPPGFPEHGLLQLFICLSRYEEEAPDDEREMQCSAEPFELDEQGDFATQGCLARVVQPAVVGTGATPTMPHRRPLGGMRIVDWVRADSYPSFGEQEDPRFPLRIAIDEYDRLAALGSPYDDEYHDCWLGWPCLMQGPLRLHCAECDQLMVHVLSIQSRQSLPIMIGDVGQALLFACPHHSDQMKLYRECF